MSLLERKFKSKIIYLIIFGLLVTMIPVTAKSAFATTLDGHTYTGEELYAGIALGQGEVAELFPELWGEKNIEELKSEEAKQEAAKILEEIKQLDPSFFNNFESAVYGNDAESILSLLMDGVTLLKQIYPNISEGMEVDPSDEMCVTIWLWTAAVAIWVAIIAGGVIVGAPGEGESTSLTNEMLVQHIIDRIN